MYSRLKETAAAILLASALSACGQLGGNADVPRQSAGEKTAQANASAAQSKGGMARKPKPVPPGSTPVETTPLGNGVYMLKAKGGNVGVLANEDGVLVIDNQFADMAPGLKAAIYEISQRPYRYVINTHYHGDHAGGNAAFREEGALLLAHENVRNRLKTPTVNTVFNRTNEPVAKDNWPDLTYEWRNRIYFGSEIVQLRHIPRAHTDGDTIAYFHGAGVLHMGDNFFNGMLPYIDVDSGGSIKGMIAAHNWVLSFATDDTKIIPGHGPLANKADLIKARDMLIDIESQIQARIDRGQNLEAILADNPVEKYAQFATFIKPEMMARIVFRSLTKA